MIAKSKGNVLLEVDYILRHRVPSHSWNKRTKFSAMSQKQMHSMYDFFLMPRCTGDIAGAEFLGPTSIRADTDALGKVFDWSDHHFFTFDALTSSMFSQARQ